MTSATTCRTGPRARPAGPGASALRRPNGRHFVRRRTLATGATAGGERRRCQIRLRVAVVLGGRRTQDAGVQRRPNSDSRRGRPAPRGRHGRLGVGSSSSRWLEARLDLPVGPLFWLVNGATRGRPWAAAAARTELTTGNPRGRRAATLRAGTNLRHAHAVEMAREGVPLIVIQRRLAHISLGITSVSLQSIDNTGNIDTVHARRTPMVPVDSSFVLVDAAIGGTEADDFLAADPRSGRRPRTGWRAAECSIHREGAMHAGKRPTPFRRSSTYAPTSLSAQARDGES